MSTWLIIIILAVLQGVAEFLPISSSGHLALLGNLCGVPTDEGAALSIVLHAGSLLAIIAFYFKTLTGFFKKDQLHLLGMVILGSIPAGIAGIALKKTGMIEMFFGDMLSVAMGFLITASILRLTGKEKLRAKCDTDLNQITVTQALKIGVVQALAIIPGISRSGSTIRMSASVESIRLTISFFAMKDLPPPDTPRMNALPFRSLLLSAIIMFLDMTLLP